MNWTKELPTNPGYYWWRKNKYKNESIFYVWISLEKSVGKNNNTLYCRWSAEQLSDRRKVSELGGEWFGPRRGCQGCGPIKPPN